MSIILPETGRTELHSYYRSRSLSTSTSSVKRMHKINEKIYWGFTSVMLIINVPSLCLRFSDTSVRVHRPFRQVGPRVEEDESGV